VLIKCEVEDFGGLGEDGVEDVSAKCMRCGNQVHGFSVAQCLFRMHQSCPGGMRHRYVEYDGVPDEREKYEPRYQGDPTCAFTAEGLALHLRIKAAYKQRLRELQVDADGKAHRR
jgi:hypothetical protein